MKSKIVLPMFMLACSFGLLAQSSTTGGTSSSPISGSMSQDTMSSDSMKHDKMEKMDGKKMSITGCVSEKDGKYMVTDEKHPNGVQLMTSEDLKPHVGHKVKFTGMMTDAMAGGQMAGPSMGNDSAAKSDDTMASGAMKHDDQMSDDKMKRDDKMAMDHNAMMALNVSKMEMKSETCDMSKMMKK